ncbi:hypothetical protein ACQKKX_20395 [Neorhizobium sp. NPDC001467]|uniref:hypothetical protein n=1 Tax=Neorhizobium sp. NPDC001467 TaxID=3390595 RepID=UPI003CFD3726
MGSKLPPTPVDNLSHKGAGEQSHSDVRTVEAKSVGNPAKQGQQGNTKVNTTHQGYQQDR